VSVRTLRHYDELGLITPTARTDAGYRLYSISGLERLQQVMLYKELGFDLKRIGELMRDPGLDREQALLGQRGHIEAQALRLDAILNLIDRTLQSLREEAQMPPEEMFDVFGDFDPSLYEDEAKRRWGDTDAYKESAHRTRGCTRQDWERIRDENEAITERMFDALDRGVDPRAPEAMDIAEEARLAIDRAFYPCSRTMHATLAEGYVTDERSRAFYDDQREGLAAWFSAAIVANAERSNAEGPASEQDGSSDSLSAGLDPS